MSYLPVENVIPFAFLRIMRARGIVNSCKFTFFLVDSLPSRVYIGFAWFLSRGKRVKIKALITYKRVN